MTLEMERLLISFFVYSFSIFVRVGSNESGNVNIPAFNERWVLQSLGSFARVNEFQFLVRRENTKSPNFFFI